MFGGVTDELKAYPQESLSAPLAERAADFSFTSGALPPNAKGLQTRDRRAAAKRQIRRINQRAGNHFADFLFGLILAFGFGATHAILAALALRFALLEQFAHPLIN